MKIITQEVWTTGSYAPFTVEITTGLAIDPPRDSSSVWDRVKPTLQSLCEIGACGVLAALLMVCLPLIALALLLLRFVIIGGAVAAVVVCPILYATHKPFRAWVRAQDSRRSTVQA